jgi:CBS domain-containing protein
MVFSYATATRIAALVGQICAVGFAFLALANPFMLLIAAFIFFGAAAEAKQVLVREQFGGFKVRDGMLRTFRAAPAKAPLQNLAGQLLDTPQRDYPVVDDGQFVGMLRRDILLNALNRNPNVLIADIMQTDVPTVEEFDSLATALEQVTPTGGDMLPVTKAGSLTGLLDLQQVLELARARTTFDETEPYVPVFPPPALPPRQATAGAT